MCTPAQVEAVIGMLSAADSDRPTNTWDLLRGMLDDGFQRSRSAGTPTLPPRSQCRGREETLKCATEPVSGAVYAKSWPPNRAISETHIS